MTNMEIYNAVRTVPENAKKPIYAGRLKGMTDINPMWRIQALTEQFGPVGIGWYYKTVRKWVEEGADGVKCAFVDIELYIKHNNEWSMPIEGTGGNSFVAKEKSGLYTSDEAFKMALTDAISVACKALGFGADVYWQAGRSKYNPTPTKNETQSKTTAQKKKQQSPNQSDFKSDVQNKVTTKHYTEIQRYLSVYPPNNRETTLDILLNEYEVEKFEDLTVIQYNSLRAELISKANGVMKQRLNKLLDKFVEKTGQIAEEVSEMLKTALGKSPSEITIPEFEKYANEAAQMLKDLNNE